MSILSERGQAILEELGLIVRRDHRFDKRMKTDPESGHPIPTFRFNPPRKYMGLILNYRIGTPYDPITVTLPTTLNCSPVLESKHDLLVWAAKNESKIREEFGDV